MLGKLMKHEFRATAKTMLPLGGLILVLSVFMAVVIRNWDGVSNPILNTLFVIISIAYGVALAAAFILVLVLMINRFRTNLLGDEGYVMMTLPVSTHQIIWSKIIVSCVWFIFITAVVILSAIIVSFDAWMLADFRLFWREMWEVLSIRYALNGTAILIEMFVLFFAAYASGCLQFYSAMAVGYSFDKRKVLISVAVYCGFQFILQMIVTTLAQVFSFDHFLSNMAANVGYMASVHLSFFVAILCCVIYGAVFYVITTQCLKKRLNIE